MVLTGTGRTTGAGLRHMHLFDPVEESGAMGRQHAGHPGRESGSDDQVRSELSCPTIKGKQSLHIGQIVRNRHHGDPERDHRLCLGGMNARASRQHHNIDIEWRGHGRCVDPGPFTQTLRHHRSACGILVAQHHFVGVCGHQLTGKASAHGADSDDGDASHISRARDRRAPASPRTGVGYHPIRGA